MPDKAANSKMPVATIALPMRMVAPRARRSSIDRLSRVFSARSPAAMQAEIKKVAIAGRRSFAVQRLDYRVRRQSSGIEFRRQERSVQAPALMDERKAQRVK
jgi:hypothetical protein